MLVRYDMAWCVGFGAKKYNPLVAAPGKKYVLTATGIEIVESVQNEGGRQIGEEVGPHARKELEEVDVSKDGRLREKCCPSDEEHVESDDDDDDDDEDDEIEAPLMLLDEEAFYLFHRNQLQVCVPLPFCKLHSGSLIIRQPRRRSNSLNLATCRCLKK
jgi:hypothetical protein